MAASVVPTCESDVADAVADALRGSVKLAITGGGSKAGFGRTVDARALPMAGLAGIVDYDPAELVLTVKPGTLLAEVEALVAASGQMLAFEPFDHGPIYGASSGQATIGGVMAAGVSGSQRISASAARDHLLGFRAVSGRGEIFAAGAKVVKNVTGYDLPKLAVGSWGRLFAMTELTIKVLPRPRENATRMLIGLDEECAVAAMARAMGSQAEVAAAAYIPASLHNGESATLLRIQGFGPSVAARCAMLGPLLADFGTVRIPDAGAADARWTDLHTLAPLGTEGMLWRIHVPPSRACELLTPPRREQGRFLLDWAGGLIWLVSDEEPAALRTAVAEAGGHAALVRGSEEHRANVPAFHPPAPGVAALEERVRRAFDPVGVFETGRF